MTRKSLSFILLLEVFGTVNAILLFRLLPSKWWAGSIAGIVFVSIGLAILVAALKSPRGIRTFSFWSALCHVAIFALPMLIMRWAHPDQMLNEMQIWGVAGSKFHGLSEAMYLVLMLSTGLDLLLTTSFRPWMSTAEGRDKITREKRA